MKHLILNAIILCIGIIIWKGNREIERKIKNQKPTRCDYLYKLHLILGKSEYEIFKIAANEKGWAEYLVEEDFKRYLDDGVMPRYLIDFLDDGKEHIEKAEVKTWIY